MKLKYYIEFTEIVDDLSKDDVEGEALTKVAGEIKETIYNFLKLGGFNILNEEINIEFDLED